MILYMIGNYIILYALLVCWWHVKYIACLHEKKPTKVSSNPTWSRHTIKPRTSMPYIIDFLSCRWRKNRSKSINHNIIVCNKISIFGGCNFLYAPDPWYYKHYTEILWYMRIFDFVLTSEFGERRGPVV